MEHDIIPFRIKQYLRLVHGENVNVTTNADIQSNQLICSVQLYSFRRLCFMECARISLVDSPLLNSLSFLWNETKFLSSRFQSTFLYLQWNTEPRTSQLRTIKRSDQQIPGFFQTVTYNNVCDSNFGPTNSRGFGQNNGFKMVRGLKFHCKRRCSLYLNQLWKRNIYANLSKNIDESYFIGWKPSWSAVKIM
jgi:hypothetical protein